MKSTAETRGPIQDKNKPAFRVRLVLALIIFLMAFGVRVLSWHDTRLEVGKVQTAVTADYQRVAQLLRDGGVRAFFSSTSPLADLNNLGHPPGYSILIALTGPANDRIQFIQMVCDALAAVVIFLIVTELGPLSAAVITGLLAAFSPQFAWNSVLLLPDSISVLPILLAIYLLARAAKNPRLPAFIIIGVLLGVSCWLRANAMLLTFLVALAVPLLTNGTATKRVNRREDAGAKKWQLPLAVVCGTLLIVLPLTIRNAIVFHRFIPLSLGAGQTMLEGIADYDHAGRFGIPQTDVGIMKQEAELYQRPDYYGTLFNPDGVERERARLARGLAVIRSHPFWFAGVMTRRASSMVRLERARLISIDPPVSHPLATNNAAGTLTSEELLSSALLLSPNASVLREPETNLLTLTGDDSKYGEQLAFRLKNLKLDTDYLLAVSVKIERGRMRIGVTDFGGNPYASTVVETVEQTRPEDQPVNLVQLPFIASRKQEVRLLFRNEASNSPNPLVKIDSLKLYELGPARYLWTRYPRLVVHALQKIFMTAVILPLAIAGLLILIFRKQRYGLVLLAVVPVYFFTVQSLVHTEYRYVLAVDYFLFALVGIAVSCGIRFGRGVITSIRH